MKAPGKQDSCEEDWPLHFPCEVGSRTFPSSSSIMTVASKFACLRQKEEPYPLESYWLTPTQFQSTCHNH